MSEGVVNSASGAYEHNSDVASGLVGKDKSTYTQQSRELQQQQITKKRMPKSRYFEEQRYYNSAYDERRQRNIRTDNSQTTYTVNVSQHNRPQSNLVSNSSNESLYKATQRVDTISNTRSTTVKNASYQNGAAYQNNSRASSISKGSSLKNEHSVADRNFSDKGRYIPTQQNGYKSTKTTANYQDNAVLNEKVETGVKGVTYSNSAASQSVSSSSQRVSEYLKSHKTSSLHRNQLLTKLKSGSGGTFRKAKGIVGSAVAGTSFLANTESFQSDIGENTVNTVKKSTDYVVDKIDKLAAKSGKSRYFRTAAKTSDSVTFVSHSDRIKKAINLGNTIGKKSLGAVSQSVSPLIKALNSSDDIGAQAVVKAVNVTRGSYNAAKMSYQTTKAAVQVTNKATRYTVNHARTGFQNAAKYSKQAASKAKKAAQKTAQAVQTAAHAAAEAAEAVASAISRFISFIMSNPITAIIAAVVLILIIIIALCSSIVGAGKYSSYGGVGDDSDTMSLNEYSQVCDYINESIATRCRDLFNLHDSWTGFLKYDYEFEIENDNGSITTTTTYPVADVAPIMAYLSITHQSYTLNDSLKNEIDNIVKGLYTFTYTREPYSYSVSHGSGGVTTYTGEKITYTIRYHNASKYMEDNNLIPEDKMTVYNAVKSYGATSYFQMYNLLKDKNWHEWVSEQYGYTLVGTTTGAHDILHYSIKKHGYMELDYKNSNNETADKIYSPINGKVTKIVLNSSDDDDDFITLITVKDDNTGLEFQLMSDSYNTLTPTVSVGTTVSAGDLIANNRYSFKFSCLSYGNKINPMLIMEYYQHAT